MTLLFKYNSKIFIYLLITFSTLFQCSENVFSQINKKEKVLFIWNDFSYKTSARPVIYMVYSRKNTIDTIYPVSWEPAINDTIVFELEGFKNPVFLEISSENIKKQSNKFNLIPTITYNLIELDNKIEVRAHTLFFDTIDSYAQTLYAFLIKLLIELLLAIPVAALFRLPARLLFFVFVANIMSFPLVYVTFIPIDLREIITVLLEGLFIYAIGWKRLKLTKALLVSLILNVLRFGIAKIIMLIIRIL